MRADPFIVHIWRGFTDAASDAWAAHPWAFAMLALFTLGAGAAVFELLERRGWRATLWGVIAASAYGCAAALA